MREHPAPWPRPTKEVCDMRDSMEVPTVEEVGDLLAEMRDITGRLARFEDVDQEELDAYQARKVELLDRLNGALL